MDENADLVLMERLFSSVSHYWWLLQEMQGSGNWLTNIDFNVIPQTLCFKNACLVGIPSSFVEKKQTSDHGGLCVNSDDDFLEITQNLVYLNQVTTAVCEVPLCDFVQWFTQESTFRYMLNVS